MKIPTLLFFFFLFLPAFSFPHFALAQADDPNESEAKNSATLFYDRINMGFNFSPEEGSNYDVHFQTRTNWVVGGSLSINDYSISAATNIKNSNTETEKRTEVSAFQINHDSGPWAFDAYWYRFAGFNLHKPGEFLEDDIKAPLQYHPEIKAQLYGGNALYFFHPDRTWIPGRLALRNKSEGFGWTPLVESRFAGTVISSSEPLLPNEAREKFKSDRLFTGGDMHFFGLGGGLVGAYSWSEVSAGVAAAYMPQYSQVSLRHSDFDQGKASIALCIRWGLAFHRDAFELGVFGMNDIDLTGTDSMLIQIDRDFIKTYLAYAF